MPNAYLALVLHAHLPFVRHPEHATATEELWLFQATTESYLPLLELLRRRANADQPIPLTLSVSPTLLAMLDDSLLRARYDRHLEDLNTLIDKEHRRVRQPALQGLLRFYQARLAQGRRLWQSLDGNLIAPLKQLQDRGALELFTCAATHGYLPLLRGQPEAVWAQLAVAASEHRRLLGRAPTGIWLPECGYYPGLDHLLATLGIRYFTLDTHGLAFATPPALAGNYAPVLARESGVAVFARDQRTTMQVWSREHGFPGHPDYREYHRDIGQELSPAELMPLAAAQLGPIQTGLKYYRVTGPRPTKECYDPERAAARAASDADVFLASRVAQAEEVAARLGPILLGRPPLIVAPFDAELFGHWWYEGPIWLEQLLQRAAHYPELTLIGYADYLARHPAQQVVEPAESSWGEGGYHQYWLDPSNDWLYPHLHHAARQMVDLARQHPSPPALTRRALNQAARELLLAQASDWAFIMRSKTTVDYAVRRSETHLRRFRKLAEQVAFNLVDEEWLHPLEAMDNLFPTLDYRIYDGAFG